MITRIFYKFLFEISRVFRKAENYYQAKAREKYLSDQCISGDKTIIYSDARIQNHQNDRNKICIGKNSQVRAHLMVFGHGGKISIGDYCYIGEQTRIWSAGEITIGNRVLIAHNVNIHDNNSHPTDAQKRHEDFVEIFTNGFQKENSLNEKPVKIGDDVWIGFNSTIMKGVTIGNGAIIGACSMVTKDVEPYTMVAGSPATFIKKLN